MNATTLSATDAAARGHDVARTILAQVGMGVRMSLGARELVSLPDDGAIRGGVSFAVGRGNPPRRFVIELAGNDTYTVSLVRRVTRGKHRGESVVEAHTPGLYCDQLQEHLIRTLDRVMFPGAQ
jgi:hypothetical protein